MTKGKRQVRKVRPNAKKGSEKLANQAEKAYIGNNKVAISEGWQN